MHSSFTPPRQVTIGDAAAFVGTTPRAIRHYHQIGLLPEPERGGDDRRRYGYEDMIRLLWIRRMADAGIALDDIRDAFTTGIGFRRCRQRRRYRAHPGAVGGHPRRAGGGSGAATDRRAADARRRQPDGPALRLRHRPPQEPTRGFPASGGPGHPAGHRADLRPARRGRPGHPLRRPGHASRLREESDRVDDAEEALDDSVAVDDPRVAQSPSSGTPSKAPCRPSSRSPAWTRTTSPLRRLGRVAPRSADDGEDGRAPAGGSPAP